MSNLFSKKTLLLTLALAVVAMGLILLTRRTPSPKTSPSPVLIAPSPSPALTPVFPPAGRGAGFESEQFKQAELEYIKQHPILQKLPVQSPFFSIEYINEQHLIVHSKTTNKERDYQAARNFFVEHGFDIDKITVEYK